MGTDIKCVAQKKLPEGRYQTIQTVFPRRSYDVFAFLAGVRNYSAITPISQPRGIPEDDDDLDTYSRLYLYENEPIHASWLSVQELLDFDYDQPIEDRRCMKEISPGRWSGAETCEVGEGLKTTYREFLNTYFFDELNKLKEIGADRIVFYFY